MQGLPIDHVAIAVRSLEDAARLFERLTGSLATPVESIESQGVRVAFVGAVELLEPTRAESPVARFLERRGGGLHHVAYRTPNLAEELERLRAAGYELIDERPRPGARGHMVAFLHPRSTGGILVELVEHTA
jgi:methylmalonyl-CoA epimerase